MGKKICVKQVDIFFKHVVLVSSDVRLRFLSLSVVTSVLQSEPLQ